MQTNIKVIDKRELIALLVFNFKITPLFIMVQNH